MPKFFMMGLKCPRFKFLAHHDVEGCNQFRETRNETIREYCVEVLKGNIPPAIDNERIANEIEELGLEEKLNRMKDKVEIDSEIQWEDEYGYTGKINGTHALFTLSTSKRWNINYALSAIYLMDNTSVPDDCIIATVMPIAERIREYPKEGILTKKGELSKKDAAGTWQTIREKYRTLMEEYDTFINETNDVPEPQFGECLLCPYHNYEIEFGGENYLCQG